MFFPSFLDDEEEDERWKQGLSGSNPKSYSFGEASIGRPLGAEDDYVRQEWAKRGSRKGASVFPKTSFKIPKINLCFRLASLFATTRKVIAGAASCVWANKKKLATDSAIGFGVGFGVRFAVTAAMGATGGLFGVLAAGAIAGAAVGAVNAFRSRDKKTKGGLIKAMWRGAVTGVTAPMLGVFYYAKPVVTGMFGIIANRKTDTQEQKEQRYKDILISTTLGIGMGLVGALSADLLHGVMSHHQVTSDTVVSPPVASDDTSTLYAIHRPSVDEPVLHAIHRPSAPEIVAEVPEAQVDPDLVYVVPPEEPVVLADGPSAQNETPIVPHVELPVPEVFKDIVYPENFHKLSDNLQQDAQHYKDMSPKAQMLFAKEASAELFAQNTPNSRNDAAFLLQEGIDVADRTGNLDTPVGRMMLADMGYLTMNGEAGVELNPSKAAAYLMMAGDHPLAQKHLAFMETKYPDAVHYARANIAEIQAAFLSGPRIYAQEQQARTFASSAQFQPS